MVERPALRSALAVLAVSASLLVARPASAQSSIDQNYGTWFGFFVSGPIYGDLWLWTDLHARFLDAFEPQAMLVRPGLTWRVLPELLLTAGYGWTPSWTPIPEPREWGDLDFADEHRLWEQVIYQPSDPGTGVAAQVRVRLEQRFRTEGEVDAGHRLRIMVRGQVPLTRDRAFIAVLWNEAFVAFNDTSWGQRGGFDQNRFFIGAGWQAIPAQLRVELGYMNQWIVRAATDQSNHVVGINTYIAWQ